METLGHLQEGNTAHNLPGVDPNYWACPTKNAVHTFYAIVSSTIQNTARLSLNNNENLASSNKLNSFDKITPETFKTLCRNVCQQQILTGQSLKFCSQLLHDNPPTEKQSKQIISSSVPAFQKITVQTELATTTVTTDSDNNITSTQETRTEAPNKREDTDACSETKCMFERAVYSH